MKTNYVCPVLGTPLELIIEEEAVHRDIKGFYRNSEGTVYPIVSGIPNFTYPNAVSGLQKEQYEYYQSVAENYDSFQHLTFAIQEEDEASVRIKMIEPLRLESSSKVLELCCGTGRDSINIAKQLSAEGELCVQDISSAMLMQCQKRLAGTTVPVDYSVGNACYLPFPDNHFDAVYSFGGLNVFDDMKRSLQEMVRVTKPGGRIVVGDESMPPWLYETEFGKILLNNNPLFKMKVPLNNIPVEAREVNLKWIIGGVYYLIDFTVGEGEPTANFDMEIPGQRGGTLRTRYYGQLEGVSAETKNLVQQAAKSQGKSMHQWLDDTVKTAAQNDLKN